MVIVGEITAPLAHGLIEISREMPVGQRFVDQGPEVLGRLEFGEIGRQELEVGAFGNDQIGRDVPTGAIEHEHARIVRSGADLTGEGGEDLAEHRRVDRIAEEPLAGGRPHEAEDIEPLEPVMAAGAGRDTRRMTGLRPARCSSKAQTCTHRSGSSRASSSMRARNLNRSWAAKSPRAWRGRGT